MSFCVGRWLCHAACYVVLCCWLCCAAWRRVVWCRVALCCRVVFWCVGLDVGVWRRALFYGVVRRYLSICRVYSMLRCALLLSRLLWNSVSCCRVCCCVLCLGVALCCCFCFVGCAPLLCHVAPLGYVRLCGLVWCSRGFVVALFVVCGVAPRSCVVMLCRVGQRTVLWCRVVATLRRVAACAVLFRCVALGVVVLFCW